MPEVGGKYVCGGLTFLCTEVDEAKSTATMSCNGLTNVYPFSIVNSTFKKYGSLMVGEAVTCRRDYLELRATATYTITDFSGSTVTLNNGMRLNIAIFASLF